AKGDAKEKAGVAKLTADEHTMTEKHFGSGTGPRDPLAALARTTRTRLIRDRQPDLVTKFREAVEKLDPFIMDKNGQWDLAEVLLGSRGAADRIANDLRKAMEGWGTDEEGIYEALAGLTPKQAELVRATYLRRFGRTLEYDLNDEMDGTELER